MINKYLLLITIVFSTLIIQSQPVDIEIVKQVAINAFYNNTGEKNIEIKDIIPVKDNKENELFYIINFKDNGFAIISAEKAMKAVLGTCSNNNFKYEDAPPGLLYLLDKYKNEVIELRRQKTLPSSKDISMWNKYNVQP